MNTIIEIGAFDGEDTLMYSKINNSIVYAFEPNIEKYNQLKKRFTNYKNVNLINKAVGNKNGMGKFFIYQNKMSSSLNAASNYSIDNQILKIESIEIVEIIKLNTFLLENEINDIDYFHCDAQGSDLDILKSLGDTIHIIKKGQVEGSRNENLYQSENHYLEIIDYLENKNFTILNKQQIEERNNWLDLNIHFCNKDNRFIL